MATRGNVPTKRPFKAWVAFVVGAAVLLIALMALFGRTRDFTGQRRYTGPPDEEMVKRRIIFNRGDRTQYKGH